ncbi:MAG TPA: alpha/beta hydrolase [Xanthobacteraceae bacterium]|nr:alpha/beta hydrolase [Xanthobacteraceae bacterium]
MNNIKDLYYDTQDGLRLHALVAGSRSGPALPVICLPGLTRTAEDFRDLVEALAFDASAPRYVIALSSRGRGLSDRDPKPENYSVPVELNDLLRVIDQEKITRAIFVGTSRGGILTMALTVARPQVIGGVVLNDIGPVLEMQGLLRIQSYVGKLPMAKDWSDAVRLQKSIMLHEFPGFSEEDWLRYAKLSWRETKDRIGGTSDASIAFNLREIDASKPVPAAWPLFDGLKNVPLLVLRGEHSDLLSRETVREMQSRHPDITAIEVAGVGHPPVFWDESTIGPVRQLAARCDARMAT